MIIAELEHAAQQAGLFPALTTAFNYLQTLEASRLIEGRYQLDGDNVFAIVASYTTREVGPAIEVEGHARYIDLQFIAAGEEALGWTPAARLTARSEYDPITDAWKGTLPAEALSWVKCSAGEVVVFFPEDAHAPGYAPDKPGLVKKVVVKVAVP